MKTKYFILLAIGALGFSSCQKEFDPTSYAPALNIGGYTSAKQVASSNLVAHWAFNGSLIDSVSNTVGVNAGASFAEGIKGQALQGALNSYITTTPSAKITGLKSFTISEWINTPPPTTGILGIFSLSNTGQFWGNLELFIENGSSNTDGKLRIVINNNNAGDRIYAVNGIQNLFDKWNHLAVSYDATTSVVSVYVNGSRVSSGTLNGITGPLTFVNSGKMVFGCVQFQTTPSLTTATGSQGWASYITGQLDEIRVYDKALSVLEISSIAKLEGRGK